MFNPIIQYLKLKEDGYGYKLNGNSVITLSYADDFNLITSNKRTHQRVINELHSITSSMNLTLKPEKCKKLSICSGSPKIVPFSLGGKELDSIKDSPMKFVGACVSFQSTSMEGFTFIHNKLEYMLKNIESTNIRPEFKVRIYTQYAMSSIRFALTVHYLTSTQRKSLDSLTTRYLKSWLGMPKCGATSAIIYSSAGLNIQSMSHLNFQCHSLSIARTFEKADIRTTQALDSKLRREDHFVNKNLGNTRANQFYQEDIEDKHISSELTCVEVGCRGYVSESNKIIITTILKSLDIRPSKRQVKELTVSISKIALLTSFIIFKCKDEPQWFDPKLIILIYNSVLKCQHTILKSGASTPRTVTKFAVKTAIDLTSTI